MNVCVEDEVLEREREKCADDQILQGVSGFGRVTPYYLQIRNVKDSMILNSNVLRDARR